MNKASVWIILGLITLVSTGCCDRAGCADEKPKVAPLEVSQGAFPKGAAEIEQLGRSTDTSSIAYATFKLDGQKFLIVEETNKGSVSVTALPKDQTPSATSNTSFP